MVLLELLISEEVLRKDNSSTAHYMGFKDKSIVGKTSGLDGLNLVDHMAIRHLFKLIPYGKRMS